MFIDFVTGLTVLLSLFSGGNSTPEPVVGAFGDPFLSRQLALSPTNTYILTTDGTNNSWAPPGAGTADGTWSTTSADFYKSVRNFFSTSSADYWETQQAARGGSSGFSTTSADYWQTQRNFFSTTSANVWSSFGLGFSTTSANAWQSVRNFFSTTSASHFSSLGLSWSTTSANYWETQQAARGGGGSGGGTWGTTTSQVAGRLINYPLNTTDIVTIGAISTTTAEFWFDPNTNVASFGTGGAGDSSLSFGPNTFNQWLLGYDETDKSFAIASSTALGTLNALTIDKNLKLTFGNASSTGVSGNYLCISTDCRTAWPVAAGGEWATTSSDYWQTQRNFFSTTSASFFSSLGLAWSTTSANAWSLTGAGFSTTSAQNWLTGVRDWQVSNSALVPTTTRGIIVNPASSTISNLTMVNSTTTNATTTRLAISGALNFGGVSGTAWSSFCTAITGSADLCDGSDASGGGSGSGNVATSSAETSGRIPFWSSTAGTPATLSGGVAGLTWDSTANRLTATNASTTLTTVGTTLYTPNIVNPTISGDLTISTTDIGSGAGAGGSITIEAAQTGSNGNPAGNLNLSAGPSTGPSNVTAGSVNITAGDLADNASPGGHITFTTDSVERGRFFSTTGFLGIGSTTPWGMLSINPNNIGSAPAFVIGSSTRTLFQVGSNGATTTGLAATSLLNCDTIDTDSSGNFRCGSDASGGGGGASFGQAWEISGGVLAPTSTIAVNTTGLFSIQSWTVATTTSVCAVGCEYTSIQTALNTLTGGGKIILKNESYTLGSTLTIPYNGITIEGEGIGTRLVCNPISANPCVDTGSGSGITHFNLNEVSVVNNGAAQTGVGVDFNETLVSGMENVWIQSFATSTRVNDALDTDLIFYNNFRNIRATDTNVCFEFGGQANNNNVYDGRCAVLANGIGFYIASSTHNVTLNNINAEPAAGAGTIGVKVFDGSHNISIKGGHLEENATGVLVGSNSHHVSIDNTFFYSTISGATGVCQEAGAYAISLNNTYSIMESGTRYCSSLSEVMAFSADTTTHIGVGTTTAKTADTRLTLEKSVSLALSPMMWIRNTGAFAAGYAGIGFDNVPGAFADGLAKIGVVPGSGYAATSFTIHVADAAKALQERFRIDVAGRVYGSFFTATSTTAASVFPYASSTALTVSGTTYLGTLNGPLQANNGVVSATTSVGVLYGGTGLTSIGASSTALVSSGSAYVARNLDNWITSIITSASLVLTGVWDFSAAVLELPNAANGTVDAIGEVTIDTTDNQLVIATSTNASFPAVLPLTKQSLGSFLISSTSKPFSAGFVSGRSIPFKIHTDGYRVTEIVCDIDAGTSIIINFDNGTGNTETVTCDTDGASVAVSTNAVVTALSASAAIETGTVSGTPDYLRVSIFGVPTRE